MKKPLTMHLITTSKLQKGRGFLSSPKNFIFYLAVSNLILISQLSFIYAVFVSPVYYSHSTRLKQFRLEIIICRICVSFDYLNNPYYTAYILSCYHFVIAVDNRSSRAVDKTRHRWQRHILLTQNSLNLLFRRRKKFKTDKIQSTNHCNNDNRNAKQPRQQKDHRGRPIALTFPV